MTFENITQPNSPSRIQYLDGLRGVAIFLVIFYHAFSRWHSIVPYGDELRYFPLFHYGRFGVQLFFMISGFVIFMSLERSKNFPEFMIRRWIRLFPAMLICSLIIYSTTSFFYERPAGIPEFSALLPGLTFIEPYWWQLILGSPVGELEGAFWSLYVEIKLYLVAGIFYFLIGGQRMIWVMIGLFLVAAIVLFLGPVFQEHGWHQAKQLLNAFSGRPCGWFAAGALFYRHFNEKKQWLLVVAIITAVAAALVEGKAGRGEMLYEWRPALAATVVALIFMVAALNQKVQKVLANKLLLTIGFISYPLYLLHENMMVSLIIKSGHLLPWVPPILMPVIPITIVIGIAYLVARYFEPPIRSFLKALHLKLQARGWG